MILTVFSTSDSERKGIASSGRPHASASVNPIMSLYIPPALFAFSISTARSASPIMRSTSAMFPHSVLSFICGFVFCAISCLLFSKSSNARRISLFSPRSVPNTLKSPAALNTISKEFGYFFNAFSASARPASSLSD